MSSRLVIGAWSPISECWGGWWHPTTDLSSWLPLSIASLLYLISSCDSNCQLWTVMTHITMTLSTFLFSIVKFLQQVNLGYCSISVISTTIICPDIHAFKPFLCYQPFPMKWVHVIRGYHDHKLHLHLLWVTLLEKACGAHYSAHLTVSKTCWVLLPTHCGISPSFCKLTCQSSQYDRQSWLTSTTWPA